MRASESLPTVSILIINWNTRELLHECLTSVFETTKSLDIEVIVLDNSSTDGSSEMVADKFPGVMLKQNQENVGFARGNNQAAESARGKFFLLLNSDARLLPGALETLLTFAAKTEKAAVVGAQLVNPDGSFQFSYADFPNLLREFLTLSTLGRRIFGPNYPSHKPEVECGPQIVDYVNGACLLIRSDIYRQLGGLPDQYFMYAEEVDFCLTVKLAGVQVWYHPEVKVIHHGSASSQTRLTAREGDMYQSRVRFIRKYRGNLAASLLKIDLVTLTATKVLWHGLIRGLSHGKFGRPVISLRQLILRLREV